MDILKKLGKILAVLVITFAGMAATCGGSYTVLLNFSQHSATSNPLIDAMFRAALITIPVGIVILYWSIKLLFFRKNK